MWRYWTRDHKAHTMPPCIRARMRNRKRHALQASSRSLPFSRKIGFVVARWGTQAFPNWATIVRPSSRLDERVSAFPEASVQGSSRIVSHHGPRHSLAKTGKLVHCKSSQTRRPTRPGAFRLNADFAFDAAVTSMQQRATSSPATAICNRGHGPPARRR